MAGLGLCPQQFVEEIVVRKIHYFEDGGPSDGGDNTSSAFNNNNTNDNTNNTPADNTPSAPADRNADVADAQIRQDAQDTQGALQALGTPPSGEDRGAFVPMSPLSIAQSAYNADYKNAQEMGPVSPLDQANLLAKYTTTLPDKWTQPATKNSEAVERNDLKFDISPAQLLGQTPEREVLKALGTIGLGGVYGAGGINPGQSADNIIASQNVDKFITTTIDIAKNFMPGYGVAMFAANLLSGKMTVGQAFASVLGDQVAGALKIPTPIFRSLYNAEAGDGVAGVATNALNSYISSVGKIDPRITGTFLSQTPLSSTLKSSLSSLNGGPNVAGAVAGTMDSALSSIGIGNGPATTSASVPYTGTDMQSQVDNILNPSRISPTTAPISLDKPTSSTAPATGNISSADTPRGLTMPTLLNTSGLMRVGNGTQYAGSEKLNPLTYKQEQNYGIQQDPNAYATAASDIAKMEMLPFTQSPLMVASGGSIHHFADGGIGSSSMSSDGSMYGDMIQALSKFDSPDATPTALKPRPDLLRNGQIGYSSPPKIIPQLASLLQSRGMHLYAEGGQPDHEHPNYDGTPVFRTGGLEGLGGKYVEGKGDGTSDDITAMLANGEYVFSADVVSALGNGSNKAGAKELDHMVQAIRSRARSAPPDKLPPDAKSPLEYLKSKGKNHGTN